MNRLFKYMDNTELNHSQLSPFLTEEDNAFYTKKAENRNYHLLEPFDYFYLNDSDIVHDIILRMDSNSIDKPVVVKDDYENDNAVTYMISSTINFSDNSKIFTHWDKTVMDAIYTLQQRGCFKVTPRLIGEVIVGNKYTVNKGRVKDIISSLDKLNSIETRICCHDNKYSGKILYYEQELIRHPVNGRIINSYSVPLISPLYSYAEKQNKILKCNNLLRDFHFKVNLTKDNVFIRDYVLSIIAKGLFKNKSSIDLYLNYYTHEDYKDTGILNHLGLKKTRFVNWDDKKYFINKSIESILDGYIDLGLVKAYKRILLSDVEPVLCNKSTRIIGFHIGLNSKQIPKQPVITVSVEANHFLDNWITDRGNSRGYKYIDQPGCYAIKIYDYTDDNLEKFSDIYIGQSITICSRVKQHLTGYGNGNIFADIRAGKTAMIDFFPCKPEEMNDLEKVLIDKHNALESYNNRKGGAADRIS